MASRFLTFFVIVLSLQINCILAENFRAVFGKDGVDDRGITVKENEPLELICFLDTDTIFIERYGHIVPWSERRVSSYQMTVYNNTSEDSEKKYKAVVRFDRTVYGDSGEYWCGDPEKRSEKMYMIIFVESTESFFAEKNIRSRPKISFDRDVMPKRKINIFFSCFPTSSAFEVVHLRNMKEINYQYPTEMFYLFADYPGVYTCQLKKDGRVVAEKSFEVVDAKCPISKPKITGYQLPHATRNQSLRMNCTIEDNFLFRRNLSWNVRDTNRITIRKYSIPNSEFANCMTMIEEVELKHVTDDDVGEFRCNISDGKSDLESAAMKLRIHDANFTKCKLSARNSYKGIITKDVEVVVLIDSYPHQPEITWKDQNANATIKQKEKFVVDTNETQTKLTIKNFSLSDEGNYTVEAKTPDHLVSKSIRLEVWENPFVKCLNNAMPYYMQNTTVRIDCITSHNSKLHITWRFEPNPDSLSPSSQTKIEDIGFTSNNKTVTWTIQSSGNLSCEACIHRISGGRKCHTVIRQILMTDVPDGFGIIGPKEELMIGDSFELICAASIYHYTDQIEWKNSNGSPLDTTDQLKIIKTKTLLSHRALLTIDSTGRNNSKYTCSSVRKNGVKDSQDYVLNVHDPMKVSIISTNMNEVKSTYFIDEGKLGFIILTCYSEGMPQPAISWLKDNVQIDLANPIDIGACVYRLFNNSQELQIEYFHEGCSGVYKCLAVNRFSREEVSQTIIIRDPSQPEKKTKQSDIIMMWLVMMMILLILCMIVGVYCWIDKIQVEDQLIKAGVMVVDKGDSKSQDPELGLDEREESPMEIISPMKDDQHLISSAFHRHTQKKKINTENQACINSCTSMK